MPDFRPLSKPRYRWSQDACRWVLQGAHRLTPPEVWPSNLLPALPRVDRFHIQWVKRIEHGTRSLYDA